VSRRTDDLLELVRGIAAGAVPGEQVEAYASRSRDTDIKVFGGVVEELAVAESGGVGVRVVVEGRMGYAWAGSLEPDVVGQVLEEARDNARFSAPDDWNDLPTLDDARAAPVAELELWRDDLASTSVPAKIALTLDLERATLGLDPRIRGVESTTYGDAAMESAVASSLGIEASARRTVCSCTVSAMAGEGDGTRTGYGFSVGRSLADLDPDRAARDAVERSTRLLGAAPVSSRRVPVVFDPLVTRSFLGLLGAALNGESRNKGRTMFLGREGERVAAPHVSLVDDPTDGRAHGAAPFDAEGVPTRRTELIVDGILHNFLHNVSTGRRAGVGTTGSAVRGGYTSPPGVGARALALAPGPRSPEEIMEIAGDAFYVQSVSGLHSGTNPVSGDFSLGAEGLLLRDGAFADPVREVTIASTMPRMLLEIVEVGSDLQWLPGSASGVTLLVGEMALSGA
jgi:PmbA protein